MHYVTVKDLRDLLTDLPDNAPVLIKPQSGEIAKQEPWFGQTAEVRNASTATDDRYGSRILLLEFADPRESP